MDQFTLGDLKQLRTDVHKRSKSEQQQWLVEQMRPMESACDNKHMNYEVRGKKVCRHGFLKIYDLTLYALNAARNQIKTGSESIHVHGNALPSVQADRGVMLSAIQGIIYADCVKTDEEKIQTGATFVNMTLSSLVKMSHQKITNMWFNNQLPPGDSRCSATPPSEALIKEAIKGLRNQFGTDIHFAKDTGKWFICTKCFEFGELNARGFASQAEKAKFTKEMEAHRTEHRQARAHKDANARMASQQPGMFAMILLDGTPGPTVPSFVHSAKPGSMKGKYCLPTYWEMGKSYSNNQWYVNVVFYYAR